MHFISAWPSDWAMRQDEIEYNITTTFQFLVTSLDYLTIIRQGHSEYCGIIPEMKSDDCQSKCIFFFLFSRNIKNRAVAILKISASVL